MEDPKNSTQSIILAALSTLTPPQLSHLTTTISTLFRQHRRRLATIISSPTLFTLTLHHLHSTSLHHKTLLVSRHLLSTLSLLTTFFTNRGGPEQVQGPALTSRRHLDAALILLLLCEVHQQNPLSLQTSPANWRPVLANYLADTMLKLSGGIGVSNGDVLVEFIEMVAKCRRFVRVMGCCEGGEVAASAAVVVALPSMVSGGERECVICAEEVRKGRDVCELPCGHQFHWICILPWLRKRNTCPCCRHRLPSDDVSGEIQRLWEVVVKIGGGGNF